ncbi:uncharacterized protein KY384_002372 [Bacidia gigantensis]|uniref:uncharacterized protein n=1 Tax=Bacidia gigantensis TaxID=2732470 RepID=UPI001D042BD7|nr:uncharacterized protein KY384_002372 [Bacidia gigantensis]KAG8532495.1 hypothetical protein KY384_002372 [Bacidia gigantensis]
MSGIVNIYHIGSKVLTITYNDIEHHVLLPGETIVIHVFGRATKYNLTELPLRLAAASLEGRRLIINDTDGSLIYSTKIPDNEQHHSRPRSSPLSSSGQSPTTPTIGSSAYQFPTPQPSERSFSPHTHCSPRLSTPSSDLFAPTIYKATSPIKNRKQGEERSFMPQSDTTKVGSGSRKRKQGEERPFIPQSNLSRGSNPSPSTPRRSFGRKSIKRAPSQRRKNDGERLSKLSKKSITPEESQWLPRFLKDLCNDMKFAAFCEPVRYNELARIIGPTYNDYPEVIKKPMDLLTIRINVARRRYTNMRSVQQDIHLMANNAIAWFRYYKEKTGDGDDEHVKDAAIAMRDVFDDQASQYKWYSELLNDSEAEKLQAEGPARKRAKSSRNTIDNKAKRGSRARNKYPADLIGNFLIGEEEEDDGNETFSPDPASSSDDSDYSEYAENEDEADDSASGDDQPVDDEEPDSFI